MSGKIKVRERTQEGVMNSALPRLLEMKEQGEAFWNAGGNSEIPVSLADVHADMTTEQFTQWWNTNVVAELFDA